MNEKATAGLFDLTGRTALVTGSSRGIGREIALTLAQAGATVILHGTADSPKLREAVDQAARLGGGHVECVTADLTSPEACATLPGQCGKLGLTVDILVLNASVQNYVKIETFTDAEFRREFQVNLGAAFQLIQAFAPAMRERKWGRIVTIGSINQLRPAARLSIYSTTKAALANLTANLAKSFAADNVTVNNLVPGVILTDRNEAALRDDALRTTVLGEIPAGRFGTTDELAGAALLLCSDAGSYITGAELPVTGGMHL